MPKTRKKPSLKSQEKLVEKFNARLRVGSAVEYWETLEDGPMTQTVVTGEAFVGLHGLAVCMLKGKGQVSVLHVFVPEEQPTPAA